jgi:hypothetical protein
MNYRLCALYLYVLWECADDVMTQRSSILTVDNKSTGITPSIYFYSRSHNEPPTVCSIDFKLITLISLIQHHIANEIFIQIIPFFPGGF